MLICDDLKSSCHIHFFWSYSVSIPSFKSINSNSLFKKKYDGGNFTPIPVSDYEVKIYRWEWGYMNLLSLPIHWIASHFLNIAFYKLFYTWFYCSYFCGTKSFVGKTELYFISLFFLIWFGVVFRVMVLKVL